MREVLGVTYPNEFEARLLADRLWEEGIRSMVKPLGPGYGLAGPVSFIAHAVYVLEGESERAKAIAAGDEPVSLEGSPESPSQ